MNPTPPEEWSDAKIKRRTLVSFGVMALASTGLYSAWRWLGALPKTEHRLSETARKALKFNEKVNGAFFSNSHLAPTYPKAMAATKPRTNGWDGLKTTIDFEAWRMEVLNNGQTISVAIEQIKALPKQDLIFDFKCVEGWNQIVHYGGASLGSFLEKYNLGKKPNGDWYAYMGLETPDGKYYVGIDMKTALHPQTLLCYELNEAALSPGHGYPLRLITPLKYGVKNLKRIGKMFFSDEQPRDFWHEQGYDYDLAL